MLHLCSQGSTLRVLTLNRFVCVLIHFNLLETKAVNDATVSANNKVKILENILGVLS